VICISLEQVRRDGPDRVAAILEQAHGGIPIVANAACDEDLEVLALGVLAAERRGKKFIYRTSASFVKVRGGVDDMPLLTRSEVKPGPGAGLVVAGSYVARTTAQIDRLVEARRASPVEISAALLLSGSTHQQEVGRVTRAVSDGLARGVSVLVYTTRGVLNATDFLAAGRNVMSGLCEVVAGIEQRPGFLVAKGGMTSIALARSALGCTGAEVLGQILRGIPVWRLGAGSRWSDVPYVVFPGNVGDSVPLLKVVENLTGSLRAGTIPFDLRNRGQVSSLPWLIRRIRVPEAGCSRRRSWPPAWRSSTVRRSTWRCRRSRPGCMRAGYRSSGS
jgi:uncharacterized protein YgbK (DUF1537 family)